MNSLRASDIQMARNEARRIVDEHIERYKLLGFRKMFFGDIFNVCIYDHALLDSEMRKLLSPVKT